MVFWILLWSKSHGEQFSKVERSATYLVKTVALFDIVWALCVYLSHQKDFGVLKMLSARYVAKQGDWWVTKSSVLNESSLESVTACNCH